MAGYWGRWDVELRGPLGEDAVRALHQPVGPYHIRHLRYPAGADFSGSMRNGLLYIVSGRADIKAGGSTLTVRPGDIAYIPAGGYGVRVLGPEPLEFIGAWKLPEGTGK